MNSSAHPAAIRPRPSPEPQPMTFSPILTSDSMDTHLEEQLRKLYHFFLDFPVMQLRKIAKVWHRRQVGLKRAIVARVYLYVLDRVSEDGSSVDEIVGSNPLLSGFQEWCMNVRNPILWERAPDRPDLIKLSGISDHSVDEHDNADAGPKWPVKGIQDNELSLSEFARLVLLLHSNHCLKKAIFDSRQEVLTAAEKIEKTKFWSTSVERQFNENSFQPQLKVEGPFENIEAQKKPLRYRKGDMLMESFGSARQSYLIYVERWRKGGLDPNGASFIDILPRNGRGGGISRTGKRALMLFKLFECWTESEDVLLLGLSGKCSNGMRQLRTMQGAMSYDDEDGTDIGMECPRAKRRRRSDAMDSKDSYEHGILHAMKMMLKSKKSDAEMKVEKEMLERKRRMGEVEERCMLMKSMEEGRRIMREYKDDEEFRKVAEMFYCRNKKEFLKLMEDNCG